MDRDRFVLEGRERWRALEELLDGRAVDAAGYVQLSRLYRAAVADLSRARGHDMPEDVLAYLNDLAGRAHHRLYGARRRGGHDLARLVLVDVPREVRAQAVWFWAAAAMFYVPALLAGFGAWSSAEAAALVLTPAQLDQVREMYADRIGRGAAGADATMAGFYVFNNVGIAFRCFATGALGGLGSVFFLVYNGAFIGTVFGHLAREGVGWNLLEFTSGHTAWELTGIVLSGAAGLRLGWAMVDTGGLSVAGSLRRVGPTLFRLVVGAAVMLLVAAAIEGFWSASPVPLPAKLVFGAAQLVLVALWLVLGGRERA